ncbi:OmpH family outer membrane protein [Rhodobacteraceae bacterium]|nr:OmpH family outer membrane protein [Paracoccaceae bacterium]
MRRTSSILRSRRNSKVWLAATAVLAALALGPVAAQTNAPILTIDQERLVSETRLGASIQQDIENRAQELAAENKTIENDLIAEEQELTTKRTELPAEEFRVLADAFDTKVQRLRDEQDEKERALNRMQEEARSQLLVEAANIISEIVRARGALLVIDRRDVFLSAGSIDITDEAIQRINEARSEPEE